MTYYKKRKYREDYTKEQYTKCWTCKKACGGCSWSREFKPIEGWKAKKTYIPYNKEHADSFMVYDCPEYERG